MIKYEADTGKLIVKYNEFVFFDDESLNVEMFEDFRAIFKKYKLESIDFIKPTE